MNALVKNENTALAAITETELLEVLQSSLYPGAKLSSIKLVLGYCKAAGLDPMKKPVHLVSMKVATGQLDDKGYPIKETRDVIMPGVGLYRTEAARTGQYTGMGDTEYGPTKTLKYLATKWENRQRVTTEAEIEYPEWARVTVERTIDGKPCKFVAKEYWLENYATQSADSNAPNAMWLKRPFAQLGKCAEAQALRKAFPDTTGSQPTAEEMEGRGEETTERHMGAAEVVKAEPTPWPDALFADRLPEWRKAIAEKRATADAVVAKARSKHPLTAEQEAAIRAPAAAAAADNVTDASPKVTYAQVAEKLNKAPNEEKLAEAAALIAAVADEQQRAELTAIYESRGAALADNT